MVKKYPTQNVIAKKEHIDNVLAKFSNIYEVYVDDRFTLKSPDASIYVVASNNISFDGLLNALSEAFPGKLSLYITYNNPHISLLGRKLMWRKGRWYIDY